jgi:hypothetical protein
MTTTIMTTIMMVTGTIGIEIKNGLAVRDIPAPPPTFTSDGIRLLPRFHRASNESFKRVPSGRPYLRRGHAV